MKTKLLKKVNKIFYNKVKLVKITQVSRTKMKWQKRGYYAIRVYDRIITLRGKGIRKKIRVLDDENTHCSIDDKVYLWENHIYPTQWECKIAIANQIFNK